VVIVDHGYVNTLSKTNLVEETLKIMRIANQNAVPISIITNQAGVAHGFFSEIDLIQYNLDLLNMLNIYDGLIKILLKFQDDVILLIFKL
jgi:D-glycero-D-manno-heptose 1,7-bisphosphate phosphatase